MTLIDFAAAARHSVGAPASVVPLLPAAATKVAPAATAAPPPAPDPDPVPAPPPDPPAATAPAQQVAEPPLAAVASTGDSPGGVWACIREKESSGDYGANTGNGYYGAYQFLESTWLSLGATGYPNEAPPAVQDAMAQELQQRSGWSQWSTHWMCGV